MILIVLLLAASAGFLVTQLIDDRTTPGLWTQSLLNRPLPPAVVVPPQQLPSPNAFDRLQSAGQVLVDAEGIKHDATSPDLAVKQAHLSKNSRALALLRSSFAYSFEQPRPFPETDDLRYFHDVGTLVKLLHMEMALKNAKGDWYGVACSAVDEICLGAQLQHAGSPRLLAMGFSIQPDGYRQAWRVIDHLDARQAQTLSRRLERTLRAQPSCADSLQALCWYLEALCQDEAQRLYTEPTQEHLILRRVMRRELYHFDDYMQTVIANARQPYRNQPQSPTMPAILKDLLLDQQREAIRVLPFAYTRREALKRLLLISLALRQYRVEHGRYPAQLSVLAPAYLAAVPDDPFALKAPFMYRPTGNTYLLYSVGPDGQDDGGTAIADTNIGTTSIGDLVAGGKP